MPADHSLGLQAGTPHQNAASDEEHRRRARNRQEFHQPRSERQDAPADGLRELLAR